jgi:hypothetical protein
VSDPHDAAAHDRAADSRPDGQQHARWGEPERPAGVLAPPVTGDGVVDEAVAQLAFVSQVPVDEQPAIYDAVHRVLQDRLADVEG